jgi:glyoxylase-like metal-dependent hydrolase (beta-lactamase superfamily II)
LKKLIVLALVLQTLMFADFFNFQPVKITDDIACVIGDYNPVLPENKGFVSNVCYVDTGDFLVLLDTGATYNFAKELSEFIEKKEKKKIKYVVLTNYHDDRLLGASYFKAKNIPIIGAFNLPDAIKAHREKYKGVLDGLDKKLTANTKVVTPDILVEKEYEIKGKNKSIFVIKPSLATQSATDLIVHVPKDSFIFTGNTIFNGRFVNYAEDSNMDEWIKALHVIKNINAKYVLGGHGDDFSRHSYEPTLKYLEMLREQVIVANEKDIDPADLSKHIHTDEFKSIPHYKELSMRNARSYFNQLEFQ